MEELLRGAGLMEAWQTELQELLANLTSTARQPTSGQTRRRTLYFQLQNCIDVCHETDRVSYVNFLIIMTMTMAVMTMTMTMTMMTMTLAMTMTVTMTMTLTLTITLTLELHWCLPRDGPSVVCQLFDDDDDYDYDYDYDNDNDDCCDDDDAGDDSDDDDDSGCVGDGDGDDYYGSEWECELGTPVLLQETV